MRFGPTIHIRVGFDLSSLSRFVCGTKLMFPKRKPVSWMSDFGFVDLNWAIRYLDAHQS